ncbi:MAG: hypothetical protein R3A47_08200 [Polyangiales bacterium]
MARSRWSIDPALNSPGLVLSSFFGRVDGESLAIVFDHGEAAPVHGDRFTEFVFVKIAFDRKSCAFFVSLKIADLADALNQPGEHDHFSVS